MIADSATIFANSILGYTHLVHKGNSYFVCLESDESKENFRKFMQDSTGKPYAWTQEATGAHHHVLYREDLFICGEDSRTDLFFSSSEEFELPINCSSLFKMFHNRELNEQVLEDIGNTDFSGIESASQAFAAATLERTGSTDYISLVFSGCVYANQMFKRAVFNCNNTKFEILNASWTTSMFAGAQFCQPNIILTFNTELLPAQAFNCAVFNEFPIMDKNWVNTNLKDEYEEFKKRHSLQEKFTQLIAPTEPLRIF